MFGAIYIGLSGLNAYSRGLQQISNNVANMNSLGFKASQVSFYDLVGLNGRGGLSYSGSSDGGGTGVGLGAARRDFSSGELRLTDRDLDLAINGSGFLVLLQGSQTFYTRTGSFEVDADGFIVLSGTDYRLATIDDSGRTVSLSIDTKRTNPPTPTTKIEFSDNLSAETPAYSVGDVRVFDSKGGEHVWQISFSHATDAPAGEWTVKVTDDKLGEIDSKTLRFNQGIVDPTTDQLLFEDTDAGLAVTLDFSRNVTSFSSGSVSSLGASSVDGYGVGAITALSVNADGALEITYSNDQKSQLGFVAVADFRDPQLLEDRGGGLLVQETDAGRELSKTGDPRVGRVLSRRLEASNVDLTQQFGDLILVQRGFQASSQIISVSNDMIQQLFGIRGQA